jgi:hypothetical protein
MRVIFDLIFLNKSRRIVSHRVKMEVQRRKEKDTDNQMVIIPGASISQ